ncbi:hypothetical protein BSKO_04520 [Bryopsis sp. KO-2023]|nr:hypothetical protein BSKO_04520 [Bryopsis sp. KO-2023]
MQRIRSYLFRAAANTRIQPSSPLLLGTSFTSSKIEAASLCMSAERVTSTELFRSDPPDVKNLALILLNYHLPKCILPLWHRASLQVCADGGANRLFDMIPGDVSAENYLPNAIRGDLDSIRPDVREFYSSQGVPIYDLSHDQDSTDLEKCLKFVEEHLREGGKEPEATILIAGALGGRLDQTLASIHALHKYPHLPMVLMGEGNLTRLIHPGKTRIKVDRAVEGPQCGLIPMDGPVIASSSGLKWNLDKTRLDFQGLISTSNLLAADEVLVDSDGYLIWTTELHGDATMARLLPK